MKNSYQRILFIGELPENSLHGISIANKINLDMLKSEFEIEIVEDKSGLISHDKVSLNKIIGFILNNLIILFKSITKRYRYFYLVYSLSFFGCIKSLAVIVCFRICNRGEVVLHIHRGDFFSRFYVKKLNKIITKLAFHLSGKIIVLSENQKSEFEKVFSGKFCILTNTVTTEYPVLQKSVEGRKFIYISNYLADKGIIDLLEAFSSLAVQYPDITLTTYGAFSDTNFKCIVKGYESSNIFINDIIYEDKKFRELSEADCLIMPSWNEGQPLIIIEAMSVKTPVIASGVGLIPELLGKEYPFITDPADKESLKRKIIEFIEREKKQSIGEYLYKRYLKYHSRKVHYEKLKELFC
jgi:glycosyltransferase involved in cell wall biosynthesis